MVKILRIEVELLSSLAVLFDVQYTSMFIITIMHTLFIIFSLCMMPVCAGSWLYKSCIWIVNVVCVFNCMTYDLFGHDTA